MDDLLGDVLENFPYGEFSRFAKGQVEGWIRSVHAAHGDFLREFPHADPDEALDAVLEALEPSEEDEIVLARIVDAYQRMIDFC